LPGVTAAPNRVKPVIEKAAPPAGVKMVSSTLPLAGEMMKSPAVDGYSSAAWAFCTPAAAPTAARSTIERVLRMSLFLFLGACCGESAAEAQALKQVRWQCAHEGKCHGTYTRWIGGDLSPSTPAHWQQYLI
jgi:hypothetical protein